MSKLIMTKGLPGSGKSTWARFYQSENPNTVLVSKDELRAMLHNSVHSKGRERFVLETRDFIITHALSQGHDVIVHDTNFNPVHEARFRQIAQNVAEFEIKDFTDVSIEVCIERDLKRPQSVGERVIKRMHREYLVVKVEPPQYNPDLKGAIICDLDGTLALFGDSNPYDRDFSLDRINPAVMNVLAQYKVWDDQAYEEPEIIFVSGRLSKFRDVTEAWLKDWCQKLYEQQFDWQLHMRQDGDFRKDNIVKQELYEEHIKGKYNVWFILDDRNQVVDMWRSLGLTVFQVAEGDF